MRLRYASILPVVLSILALTHPEQSLSQSALPREQGAALGQRAQSLAASRFIENRGQWPSHVSFFGHTDGLDVWITRSGVVFDAYAISNTAGSRGPRTSNIQMPATMRRAGHRFAMQFIGARAITAHGVERVPGTYNYLIGRDSARWTRGASHYRSARAQELYPGVDAVFYYDGGRPRYDLVLAPHADPGAIRFRIAGATYTRTTPEGYLAIGTSMGEIVQRELVAYQTINGEQQRVPCAFRVKREGIVSFNLGTYDKTRPLVIDPLLYSSYLGGSGNDEAFSVAVDGSGNAYVGGYTSAWLPAPSDSFPTTIGAYDRTYNDGVTDAFVTKLDCKSDTLIYSTVIGGASFDEIRSIVLDGSSLPVIGGFSGSGDFPTTGGSYSPSYVGGTHDGVVFKLNQSGSALVFSTYVGGHGSDAVHAIALMPGGNIRMTGYTSSLDFPVTGGAYDTTFNGPPGDAWLGTLTSSGSALTSATYIGGSVSDAPSSIVLDGVGNAYVAGLTSSSDFPVSGAYDPTYNGGQDDAFIITVAPGDGSLLYSTFMGGTGQDEGTDIDLAPGGHITYTGFTSSRDFPVTPGSFRTVYAGGAADAFVGQLELGGGSLRYSTYLGTSSDEYAYGLDIIADGRAFVCGTTAGDSFPTTTDAYDRIHKRNSFDCFVSALTGDGSALDYSTFVGGTDRDVANDIRVSSSTVLYFCGTTKSQNYPTTKRRYDDTLGRVRTGNEEILSYDAFITKLDLRNVTVTSPITTAILCPGKQLQISWVSPRLGSVRIDFSTDSGATYNTLIASSISTGTYAWTVPGDLTPGRRYRIRVAATDDTLTAGFTAFLQVPPPITRSGGSTTQTPCPGASITLNADAQGMGLRYQWTRNGTDIADATGGSYTIASASTAADGSYAVRITDTCGSVSTFPVSEVTTNLPPLTETPTSQRVCAGDPATFRVVTSASSATFQWLRNGQTIPGATSATYTIPSVQESDAATYAVRVGYAPCTALPYTTPPAQLTVGVMEITTQPVSQRVALGASATFSVSASGTGLTYQWRKNGVDIPGATTSTYTIPSVAVSDTGFYDVMISGPCTKTSTVVTLRIEGIGSVPGERKTLEGVSLAASPNPASHDVIIRVNAPRLQAYAGLRLELYDGLGNVVADLTPSLIAGGYRSATADVRGLPAGMYFCRLSNPAGSVVAVKVIVE